jgi:hypothetical protein
VTWFGVDPRYSENATRAIAVDKSPYHQQSWTGHALRREVRFPKVATHGPEVAFAEITFPPAACILMDANAVWGQCT